AKVPEPNDKQGFSFSSLFTPFSFIMKPFKSDPSSNLAPRERAKAQRQAEAVRKLEDEWVARQASIAGKWRQIGSEYAEIQLTPRRADVQVQRFGLGWAPYWQVFGVGGRVEMLPAYR